MPNFRQSYNNNDRSYGNNNNNRQRPSGHNLTRRNYNNSNRFRPNNDANNRHRFYGNSIFQPPNLTPPPLLPTFAANLSQQRPNNNPNIAAPPPSQFGANLAGSQTQIRRGRATSRFDNSDTRCGHNYRQNFDRKRQNDKNQQSANENRRNTHDSNSSVGPDSWGGRWNRWPAGNQRDSRVVTSGRSPQTTRSVSEAPKRAVHFQLDEPVRQELGEETTNTDHNGRSKKKRFLSPPPVAVSADLEAVVSTTSDLAESPNIQNVAENDTEQQEMETTAAATSSTVSATSPAAVSIGKRTTVRCLLCDGEFRLSRLHDHIHLELHYSPHECAQCPFTTVTLQQLSDHQLTTGHICHFWGRRHVYKDLLVARIYQDCIRTKNEGSVEWLFRNPTDAVVATANPEHSSIIVPPATQHPSDSDPKPSEQNNSVSVEVPAATDDNTTTEIGLVEAPEQQSFEIPPEPAADSEETTITAPATETTAKENDNTEDSSETNSTAATNELGGDIQCQLCPRSVAIDKPSLMRHAAAYHLKNTGMQLHCSHCKYRTVLIDKLEKHYRKESHTHPPFNIIIIEQRKEVRREAKVCFPDQFSRKKNRKEATDASAAISETSATEAAELPTTADERRIPSPPIFDHNEQSNSARPSSVATVDGDGAESLPLLDSVFSGVSVVSCFLCRAEIDNSVEAKRRHVSTDHAIASIDSNSTNVAPGEPRVSDVLPIYRRCFPQYNCCVECGKNYSSRRGQVNHATGHFVQFACPYRQCGISSGSTDSLGRHLRHEHEQDDANRPEYVQEAFAGIKARFLKLSKNAVSLCFPLLSTTSTTTHAAVIETRRKRRHQSANARLSSAAILNEEHSSAAQRLRRSEGGSVAIRTAHDTEENEEVESKYDKSDWLASLSGRPSSADTDDVPLIIKEKSAPRSRSIVGSNSADSANKTNGQNAIDGQLDSAITTGGSQTTTAQGRAPKRERERSSTSNFHKKKQSRTSLTGGDSADTGTTSGRSTATNSGNGAQLLNCFRCVTKVPANNHTMAAHLWRHVLDPTHFPPYRCGKCAYAAFDVAALRTHWSSTHPSSGAAAFKYRETYLVSDKRLFDADKHRCFPGFNRWGTYA